MTPLSDELDLFVCPTCGRGSETCKCDDDLDYDWMLGSPPEDEWFEPYEERGEIVCEINGVPMTKHDLELDYI